MTSTAVTTPANIATNAGQHNVTGAQNDDNLLALFLATKGSEQTQRVYAGNIADFLDWVAAPLADVTMADVVTYRDWLTDDKRRGHVSPATARNKLAAVKSLFSFAHKTGYLRFNVAAPVSAPKHTHRVTKDKVLTEEQIFTMLAQANDKEKAVVLFLYSSACRIGEIVGVKWSDFTETGSDKTVNVWVTGKTGGREISISRRAYDALASAFDTSTEYVFQARSGQPVHTNQVRRWVKSAGKRCGIDVHAHIFRHSHISHALERGASINEVKQQSGHKSLDILATYVHSDDGSAKYLAV